MTAREALRLGTRGGAAVLGRDDIGSLEPGKQADFAVWRTDGLELGGADDPVAGLVFSAPHRVDRLVVGGEDVVRGGALVRADEAEIARAHRVQAQKIRRDDHLALHPRARHRRRSAGRRACASSCYRGDELVAAGETDADGRARLAEGLEPGSLPARLPPAVALLPPGRARARARRGPLPRPPARLPVRCASYRGS